MLILVVGCGSIGKRHIGNLGALKAVEIIAHDMQWERCLEVGQECGIEAIRLVSDYAFKRLNLHKVTAGIVAIHQASIKAFEKAGFEIEG